MVVTLIVNKSERWVKERNRQGGFTLWEILLVICVMGMILTLAMPHFGSAKKQVWVRVDLANRLRIEGAAQLYRIDVGTYPQNVKDLVHAPNGVSRWCGPYLEDSPINPFNSAQVYQIDALGQVK